MKRIFSNKSGFTLVEIVVAFAVFAIMAGMILSMVQLTVKARTSNDDLAMRTEEQSKYLTAYYVGDSDKYVTGEADGKFVLDFNSESCEVYMNYAIRGMETNEAAGINYFIGNTDYENPGNPNNGGGGLGGGNGSALGQNQTTQVDTRLTGNKNLAYIIVEAVDPVSSHKCAACTAAGAATCTHEFKYYITVKAQGKSTENSGTVPKEEVPFLQYKMRFYSTDDTYTKSITESDGNTYTYTFHNLAHISDYGYVNSGTEVRYNQYAPSSSGDNKYVVSKSGNHIITVSAPISSSGGYEFNEADKTKFWVVFTGKDPKLTVGSFGSNGVATPDTSDGDAKLFTNTTYKSNSPNIFGAFNYTKVKES